MPFNELSMKEMKRYFVLVPAAIASLMSGCATRQDLVTIDQIPELMEAFDVDGVAVSAVSGNDILISDGFGVFAEGDAYTSTSSCGLYSATKVFSSIVYAKLAEDGRIDLDAPLGDYIDGAPDAWRPIPFYRLLNHTSGITMAVNKAEFGDIASNPAAGNEDIYRMIKDAPLDYQPGQYSRYRQSGYAVGEMILSDKLGVSFETLVDQYITNPAGMTKTSHPALTDDAQPRLILSAGGYETTVDDMARLFLSINNGTVIDASYWQDLLLDDKHVVGNYSLGSVIENRDGILTVGHSGGGARANVRFAPEQKVGVMVCTDDIYNDGLAISLARMLVDEITSGEAPQTPLFVALADYEAMTGREVAATYRAAAEGDQYDLSDSEGLLNMIGYEFLAEGQTFDAIEVFSLNTELFPQSPNTYDSLGEALLISGDGKAALAAYRKVLDLDPDNGHAQAMIDKIESSADPMRSP